MAAILIQDGFPGLPRGERAFGCDAAPGHTVLVDEMRLCTVYAENDVAAHRELGV